MNKIQVPPNWADLVKNSRELVMDEQYDLAATWLFPNADKGDIGSQLERTSINEPSSIIPIEDLQEESPARDKPASIPLLPTSQVVQATDT